MNIKSIFIKINGTVQGVGFRPFVFRLATSFKITGKVWNTEQGVSILAQGTDEILTSFVEQLKTSGPPLSSIKEITVESDISDYNYSDFSIVKSTGGGKPQVDITRDTAPCSHCISELNNPADRRYHHPFINCTDCGPRFTIIKSLPYDRKETTMAEFALCKECSEEFTDPSNRRFHAQPVCCNKCGPVLSLHDVDGKQIDSGNTVAEAIKLLADNAIIAIKGLGGFHLACRADSDKALNLLRSRKGREEKPFALMVKDSFIAEKYTIISDKEKKLLESCERPVVILQKRDAVENILSPLIAPGINTLGIMLPSTPLHYLLLDTDKYDILVMTSANYTSEPLCSENEDAMIRLHTIADAYLVHNRRIHIRIDDSIVRVIDNSPVIIRRARGYAPSPVPADTSVEGIIGLGGIMKSTVAVGRGESCYVSHYLGDASSIPVLNNYEQVLRHTMDILGVKPRVYAHDLHPGALTANLADKGVPVIKVQHHHAHAVACMGENHLKGKTICVVYDGLGMGTDGTIWGGEILLADRKSFERIGYCKPVPMPGGDAATLFPGRMALGALFNDYRQYSDTVCGWMDESERRAVISILESGIPLPYTSSMGRLFDACAAILDINRKQTYEGQPAIELESIVSKKEFASYDIQVDFDISGRGIINGPKILFYVLMDLINNIDPALIAARFHNTIVANTVSIVTQLAEKYDINSVCLCGGCFQNKVLFENCVSELKKKELHLYSHHLLSSGDECISYGQVLIAKENINVSCYTG